MAVTSKRSGSITGRLRPADPFELIRWLARSQNDPRKAVAELVQNSLDANATRIDIVRARERGLTVFRLFDNGEGVLPELPRQEALAFVATHIGHSRKRNLTPQQRRELMLQGKYGIGLLGFWSIGTYFEMRSQVNDSEPWVLRLTEDQPRFAIERLRGRLALRGTWTEVIVRHLHRPAFVNVGGRRIADYLASELRGQLLERSVRLTVHDRIARGRSPKALAVEPVRYPGQPLPVPELINTPHGPLRVELYALGERATDGGRVTVSCAGTVVYDDLCDFPLDDFRRPPWSDGRVTGMLDFAGFDVAPGTRRGVLPTEAAGAFAVAVRTIEPAITALLAEAQARAATALEADLLKQLQRAFRDLARLAPEYDFFTVGGGEAKVAADEAVPSGAAVNGESPPQVAESEPAAPGTDEGHETEPPELFPPGPLSSVEIVPRAVRVPARGERRFRARPRAADGREIREGVEFVWACTGPGCTVSATDGQAMFGAGDEIGRVVLSVDAVQGERRACAEALIDITAEKDAPAPEAGIPQPEFVHEAAGEWRSRFQDGRWQVNDGHRDYLIASETGKRKLRYLAALLAKEIVLHSFPHPQHGSVLERMVEVLTITDRRLER